MRFSPLSRPRFTTFLIGLAVLSAFLATAFTVARPPAASAQTAQPGYYICNGAYVQTTTPCPSTTSGYYTCSNGQLVTEPYQCASSTSTYLCNGTYIPTTTPCLTTTTAGYYTCSNGQLVTQPSQCGSLTSTYLCNGTYIPTTTPCSSTSALPPFAPTGVTITYAAGWDLVGGPTGAVLSGVSIPLYTYQANDSNYETLSPGTPLTGGVGYWALFTTSTTEAIPLTTPQSLAVPLPPSHFVMVSNPGSTPANLTGADLVLTYNPAGGYAQTSTVQPGQGAWALSFYGGTLTITNVP